MHSGYEIPGLHHQPPPENNCPPLLLSMNPTHILDQIHDHHHHFLPPHHHYAAAAAPYFPLLNFKLGLNDFKDPAAVGGTAADALLRGSEHFELPEVRQSSLGMLHAPFWEPLPAEVSNENSEIMKRQELNQKETLRNCLDAKSRLHFSELDAIYKRLGNAETTQTPPNQTLTPAHLPTVGTFESDRHHASDNIEGDVSGSGLSLKKRKTKRKKKTSTGTGTDTSSCIVVPMAEFFENLVNQVMDHQENLQRKFTEVMDRLNEERREREEAWRNQELAQFEREAAARAHDKAMAKSREAMIVSYLEKITGRRINLPALTTSEITNTTGDSNCGGEDEEMELKQQQPPTAYY